MTDVQGQQPDIPQPSAQQKPTNFQPVIYGYPPNMSRCDEIDLGDLIVKLSRQWKLMAVIVIVGTVLSVLIALSLPKVYQQEVILSRPNAADIIELNTNGLTQYSPQEIFNRYYDEIRSPKNLEQFIKEHAYLPRLYPESDQPENQLLFGFSKGFAITILEPKPETQGGIVKDPSRLSMTITYHQEEVIAEILNSFSMAMGDQLIQTITAEQKKKIANELSLINREISLLRMKAKLDREQEITLLEEKNTEQKSEIMGIMEALKIGAVIEKNNLIAVMDEAFSLAKNLDIQKPTYLSDFSRQQEVGKVLTEIKFSENQELPLYLMGTEYLSAKIAELKERSDDTLFIQEYSELQQQILLLENHARLAALKARKSDDPYIEGLNERLRRLAELQGLSLKFKPANSYRVERFAEITGAPINPDKKLIVIVGALFSMMMGFLIAIFSILLKKTDP